LFAKQHSHERPTYSLKGRVTKLTAWVARQGALKMTQTFIDRKCIGRKPEPPDVADIYRFVFTHF
jgi:hypothetical protein